MQAMPLLSIVIPTYNRLELLKCAVDSALKQTFENIEVVILNNASSDGTKAWLDELSYRNSKVKVIHHSSNIGFVNNIKAIPAVVNGAYLVVLSDDDLLLPDFSMSAMNDLERCEAAVIWYCRTKVNLVDLQQVKLSQMAPLAEDGVLYVQNNLKYKRETYFCSTVYKTATLREVGGFVGNTLTIDFSSRCMCAAKGLVLFHPRVLAEYSFHKGNTTALSSSMDWYHAHKELCDLIVKHVGPKSKYACFCYWIGVVLYSLRKRWVTLMIVTLLVFLMVMTIIISL